jgi:dual specificity phosphatase 12
MDWITDDVAIGNYLEARDRELLQQRQIRSILSLDGTLKKDDAAQLGLTRIECVRLIDDEGNDLRVFQLAVDSLLQLAASAPAVLVQCHAGRSRSAAIVAGYLMRLRDLDPEQAVAEVKRKRDINITPALERLLYKLGP